MQEELRRISGMQSIARLKGIGNATAGLSSLDGCFAGAREH
jgi:hypothetical protein